MDRRYQDCNHIWTNKNPTAPIIKKLDHTIVNDKWIEIFSNSIGSFLPHEFSDHSPCHINFSCPLPLAGTKPFKFLTFLSNHPSFLQVVEFAWIQIGSTASDLSALGFKFKSLKRELKIPNIESFSDIQKRTIETNKLLKVVHVQAMDNPISENFKPKKSNAQIVLPEGY